MTTQNCHSPHWNCDTPDTCSPKSQPSCLSVLLLPPRAIAAALSGAADVIKTTFDGGYADHCPRCHKYHGKEKECCDIPETHCPSPYVCRIDWSGCPGDSFHHKIQVTNTSKVKREFNLISVNFPCTEEKLSVTPNKKTLLPDESLQATASFKIPESFGGGTYRTKIKVAGAYEQYILVCLTVPAQEDCCCVIEQGEIPKRIKAHHWFHHFQCEELCFEPVGKEGR